MVETDLNGECDRVEGHHRQETGAAGSGLKRPSPVDQVGRQGASDEPDGLCRIQRHPERVQADVDPVIHDRREAAGDDEPQQLGSQAQRGRRGGLGHRGKLTEIPARQTQ